MTGPRIWSNDNGDLACDRHGGAYLAAAIKARPRATTHRTPLGTWELYRGKKYADLLASFRDNHLPDPACTTCGATS